MFKFLPSKREDGYEKANPALRRICFPGFVPAHPAGSGCLCPGQPDHFRGRGHHDDLQPRRIQLHRPLHRVPLRADLHCGRLFHNSAGSDDQEDYYSLDINELYAELEGRDLTGVAGEQYDVPGNYTGNYTVGSQEDFFVQPEESYKYQYGTFTCLYSGTHCRAWGLVYDDSATAAAMGKAFDETIFPGDTEAFGTARYIEDGDKLNILVYPMYSTGLCGFFRPIELLTTTSGDIGVYGQALLYSEYLKQQAGTGVFHAIHDYWRTAPAASLTDADALYSVFPESVRADIDAHVTYSSSIKDLFNDEESEFLSKMNLAYQIATALQESSGIYSTTATCSDSNPKLYTGSGCYIEGGGRLLVATADGNTFTVSPSTDCTVQINFTPAASSAPDVWDGSVKDPIFSEGAYYITSAAELAGLAQLVNSGNNLANTDVYLERDLDLNHLAWTPIGYIPIKDYLIYNDSIPFPGRFYGQGHVISGLAIGTPDAPYSETDSAGLFGCVANPDQSHDAVISGLIVKNAAVYGKDRVGILIGYAWGAKVSDCEVSGSVFGPDCMGGLAGSFGYGSSAMGTRSITRSFSSATVSASERTAGGFVGSASSVDISLCGATGDVYSGDGDAGGFVGSVGLVGGFAGSYNGSFFSASYCDGQKTRFPIGGQGANSMMLDTAQMKDQSSYSKWGFNYTWTISPYVNDGYPVLRWQVKQALSIQITAPQAYLHPSETLQLTVSLEPSATADQGYTIESSNPEIASVSPTGLVTAHRPGQVTIIARAVKGSAVGTFPLLVLSEDTIAGGFGGGSGTAEDPYLISSTAHLEHLATLVNYGVDFAGKELLQIGDLTFHCTEEDPWIPIGTENAPFRGSYNGNGYTISGLYTAGTGLDPVGLFGVAEGATIACIDLADSTFSGGTVGAIAGRIEYCGVVDCCTAGDVSVSLTSESGVAGGIIGLVADPSAAGLSQIGFCFNEAPVTCEAYNGRIGGIIGRSNDSSAQVVACRNSAAISSSSTDITYLEAGGIAGTMSGGYIFQCADTGSVSCGDIGASGGILGSGISTVIQGCYATGPVASYAGGDGSGGIVSYLTGSSSRIAQCYFGGTLPSGNQRAPIVTLCPSGTVSSTYYPESVSTIFTTPGATKLTEAQMKTASSFVGWDFEKVWTFVEGENNGYPVLRNFHPLWDGNAPVFDRAPFSEGCKDVTVVFNTQGNVFEPVQGLTEGQYITGAYDSATNRQ